MEDLLKDLRGIVTQHNSIMGNKGEGALPRRNTGV